MSQIIGIAEKTHMLSLNASIEAAKAGRGGQGVLGGRAGDPQARRPHPHGVRQRERGHQGHQPGRGEGLGRIKELGAGFSEIMKRSDEIRSMIAENSKALEDVSEAHHDIQDGLAGVDTLIRSILEVSSRAAPDDRQARLRLLVVRRDAEAEGAVGRGAAGRGADAPQAPQA